MLAGDHRHRDRSRESAEHHRVLVEQSPRPGRLDDEPGDLGLAGGGEQGRRLEVFEEQVVEGLHLVVVNQRQRAPGLVTHPRPVRGLALAHVDHRRLDGFPGGGGAGRGDRAEVEGLGGEGAHLGRAGRPAEGHLESFGGDRFDARGPKLLGGPDHCPLASRAHGDATADPIAELLEVGHHRRLALGAALQGGAGIGGGCGEDGDGNERQEKSGAKRRTGLHGRRDCHAGTASAGI
jgi:hypothetical protein